MDAERRCGGCGNNLPDGILGGLCPICLLRQGLAEGDSVRETGGPGDTISLFRPEVPVDPTTRVEEPGDGPRVLLHAAELESGPTPVVRPASPGLSPLVERTGQYHLFGEIGRGGMGSVLKAIDPELGREVVLKVLQERHRGRPELVKRFLEEAQIGGQLQHPGIVPVYDVGTLADGRPFFAMKLVKGRTLAALLAGRQDPAQDQPRFLGIFEQVCQTLAYAHSRGVIHRDLKPANVMVGSFGEVQVMDWGLAKVLPRGGPVTGPADADDASVTVVTTIRSASDADASHAGTVLGTPAYMPPEQARGETARVDERADVFALGAMLCEILTGLSLYSGVRGEELKRAAANAELDNALRRLDASGADSELVALAKACLAPAVEARPRDARAVADAVTAYLAGVQQRLRAAELAQAEAQARAAEERKRRKLTVALAASLLLCVGLGAGGWSYLSTQRSAAERRVGGAYAVAQDALRLARAAPDDVAAWAQARAAADNLLALVEAGPVGRDLAARASRLAADARHEDEAAEADRRLVAALTFARSARRELDEFGTATALAVALRGYGLGLAARGDVATQVQRLAGRPEPTRVAAAAGLDELAFLIREAAPKSDLWRRLLALVTAIDPEPSRQAVRHAWAGGDTVALRRLAEPEKTDRLAPAAVVLLADALGSAGSGRDRDAAIAVLRRGRLQHPRDTWLNERLGYYLSLRGPEARSEAIAYYRVARALDPSSGHTLAHLLADRGESGEAEAILRELVTHGWTTLAHAQHLACFGSLLSQRGQSAEAAAVLEQAILVGREAIRLEPANTSLYISLGKALSAQGQVDAAIAAYREAIRLQPDDAWAHLNLGASLQTQGRVDAAIAESREAIRLKPDEALAHCNLGALLKEQGLVDAAIAAYREAIRLKPDLAEAHYNLGLTLSSQRQHKAAVAAFREAIRLKPDHAEAHCNLGIALRSQGQHEAAVTAYREAIRLKPGLAEAHCYLGVTLGFQRQHEAAITAFREAIRLKPDLAEAHCNLGIALRSQGQYEAAVAANREAVRLKPDDAVVYCNLGIALSFQRQNEAAITAFREAIRLKPDYTEALYYLSNVLHSQGQDEAAVTACREAIRIDPDLAEAHGNLGIALSSLGQLQAAAAAYREAIRLKPDSAEAHYNLGIALRSQGHHEAAAAACREAIRLKPDLAEAHACLGIALSSLGHHEAACAAYHEAIRLKPDFVDAYYNLGMARQEQGQHDAAITAYREAIRLDPGLAEAYCNLGQTLRATSRYAEAVEALRRGHALGSKQPGWPYPSAEWLRQAEQRATLVGRRPAVLQGVDRPADAAEGLDLARMAYDAQHYAAAARLYSEVLEGEPKRADDRQARLRYDAARAAAAAGTGQGDDAPPDEEARATLRRKALDWLRAERTAWAELLEKGSPQARSEVAQSLQNWLADPDLSGVRDETALGRLPADERTAWRGLWDEVKRLSERAGVGSP